MPSLWLTAQDPEHPGHERERSALALSKGFSPRTPVPFWPCTTLTGSSTAHARSSALGTLPPP